MFSRLFKALGLPPRLRPDHGVPLATTPLARRSPLSAWWVRLGLLPEVIEPGQPQPHGRPDRLPRTLNAATTRPPAATQRAQPRTFDRFRQACNCERPHAARDLPPPAASDEPSPRALPNKLPPLADPDRLEGRAVRATGGLRWHHQGGNVSTTCAGEDVGLEEIDTGVWHGDVGPLKRGRLLERDRRLEDADGRRKRRW